MKDIEELFNHLLNTHRSVEIAHREFKRMIADDDDLRTVYAEWCEENGYSERYGFDEYAEQYIDSQNSIWDSLTDYDAEE